MGSEVHATPPDGARLPFHLELGEAPSTDPTIFLDSVEYTSLFAPLRAVRGGDRLRRRRYLDLCSRIFR